MPAVLSTASSLEFPIVLVAPGLGATDAVLEELDPSGDCRLRSLRFFSPGTAVQFTLGPNIGAQPRVFGRIAGYTTRAQRFVYQVELEEMLDRKVARLTFIIAQRRRQLAAGLPGEPVADTVSVPPLARADLRAEADFDLQYRLRETWRHATAANLSAGGLLMRAHEVLVEGMAVDTRFTLPVSLLDHVSQEAFRNTTWDRGVREAARAMLRRPFKELALRARVVCHRRIAGTIGDYGMEFCDVDASSRNEIERYCAAFRFAKNRLPTEIAL